MMLPRLNPIGPKKSVQVQFRGLEHTIGSTDGALWAMRNLCSDHFPVLSTRRKRRVVQTLDAPNGVYHHDKLLLVDGTALYYDGQVVGSVTDGRKRFAALGDFILILPDKLCFDTQTCELTPLERRWSGAALTFGAGTIYGEAAAENTITAAGVAWEELFRPGDAVTIAGCSAHPENNKTAIIREIDGEELRFSENCFVLDGEGGDENYTETGTLTVERTVPDLLYLCEYENRLWGCDERTVYASKLGDPYNWNVFDGVDTDSYAVDTGSAGPFTGCCSFLGHPVFFKEEHIYKVYGSRPSNFELVQSAENGVKEGSADSLTVAGNVLYYLSPAGWAAYTGGIPQIIGGAFGADRFVSAVGGTDGIKYFASAVDGSGARRLVVYDPRVRAWHEEDDAAAVGFARRGAEAWMLTEDGRLLGFGAEGDGDEEPDFSWFCEFADFTANSPNKKFVSKIQLRLELDAGASAKAMLRFDSTGGWMQAGQITNRGRKSSFYLPIIPRRADHFRLRLEGVGGCRVYSLALDLAGGSELQAH
ncbi:MAG: hypothetical protein IJF88_09060 [Oscillospiraceae bacterium]|nr:hypothetical protein [Oscillospiraceae bacterium]